MKTASKEISDACIIRATVSTTGFCGGDAGHGGQTEIVLEDLGGTDIEARFSDGNPKTLRIRVQGDAELRVMIDALKFVSESLEKFAQRDNQT